MNLNQNQPKNEISTKKEILCVIEEFASSSSLHGVKYIFKKRSTVKDRVIWTVAVITCIICAIGVGSVLWFRYRKVRLVIDVKDTRQPLYTFPFPTITVCSGTRVKREPAREILSRWWAKD